MEIVLQAQGLSKAFGENQVFSQLDFALHKGETLAITGPSGIGKTTLFHMLSGLTMPDQGQVILDGQDITGKAGHISYMQQKDLLLPHYTTLENVALPLRIGGMAKKEALDQARHQFAFFGLEGCETQYPHQLSGGMRQRAALLRTYMQTHGVVLLDEPFGALDAITRRKIQGWYRDLSQKLGLSTMLVTHDTDEALLLGDRVVVLNGNPAQVVAQFTLEKGPDFELSPQFLQAKKEILTHLSGTI